eukprot:1144174-Pelagomonas_calceolata.AAC.8
MSARLARTEDTVRKLEGDLAAGRVRCAQLESSVRSKELGLDKLAKALDAQRREEHDVALQVGAGVPCINTEWTGVDEGGMNGRMYRRIRLRSGWRR